jgi:hypothetical protein
MFVIAVDFDGTINQFSYPRLGPEVPGAFYWMKKFQEAGAKLILWTMRSDDGTSKDKKNQYPNTLTDAIEYCKQNGIEFFGINENPDQHWSSSRKAYAKCYIDDAAIGCPLIYPKEGRPYADWSIIGPAVLAQMKNEEKK